MESPNTQSLSGEWKKLGATEEEVVRVFRTYNAWADPFRNESEAHDKEKG
jgi:hypothetical protein